MVGYSDYYRGIDTKNNCYYLGVCSYQGGKRECIRTDLKCAFLDPKVKQGRKKKGG